MLSSQIILTQTLAFVCVLMMLCSDPTNVVLYTLAESGFVGFYDPAAKANGDLYFVARSLRPVGVAYDPVNKVRYCSVKCRIADCG